MDHLIKRRSFDWHYFYLNLQFKNKTLTFSFNYLYQCRFLGNIDDQCVDKTNVIVCTCLSQKDDPVGLCFPLGSESDSRITQS